MLQTLKKRLDSLEIKIGVLKEKKKHKKSLKVSDLEIYEAVEVEVDKS